MGALAIRVLLIIRIRLFKPCAAYWVLLGRVNAVAKAHHGSRYAVRSQNYTPLAIIALNIYDALLGPRLMCRGQA